MDDLVDYDRFAKIYDRLWAGPSCERFLPIVREHLLAKLQPGASILDLCCGPGAMSRALHAAGFQPVGVDGAAGMIALARAHSPDLVFLQQRCLELHLEEPCRAALCLYDSLNHLRSDEELKAVLERVYASLSSGPFLFDLNGEEGYRTRWRGSFNVIEDDLAVIAHSTYDQGVARMAITAFTQSDTRGWERVDLHFEQRLFPTETVVTWLGAAGFVNIQVLNASTDLAMRGQEGRLVFVCEKP